MKKLIFPISLTIFVVLFRLLGIEYPVLFNVTPVFSLFLCFKEELKNYLWIPFIGYIASDFILSNHYGYSPNIPMFLLNLILLWITYKIGNLKSISLLSKTFIATTMFYIVSSTFAWVSDPLYSKTLIGWINALIIGEPTYPLAIWFYLSSLLGNISFSLLFTKINSTFYGYSRKNSFG